MAAAEGATPSVAETAAATAEQGFLSGAVIAAFGGVREEAMKQ
jgi:hypothetical protein